MFGHLPELGLIMILGLIFFGPEKMPEVAHNIGKMIREVRGALDSAMNPAEEYPVDDFSTYYYESLARSGESVPVDPVDGDVNEFWPAEAEEGTPEVSNGVVPPAVEAEALAPEDSPEKPA